MKDLKVFAAFNEELFKEITQLLTLENFRCLSWIVFGFKNLLYNADNIHKLILKYHLMVFAGIMNNFRSMEILNLLEE